MIYSALEPDFSSLETTVFRANAAKYVQSKFVPLDLLVHV